MSTLHLVAPEARDVVAHAPPYAPGRQTVAEARAGVLALFPAPAEPVPHEEHTVPGPAGAPAVRVLLYRPDEAREPRPAILSLHGGGFIAGTAAMMATANRQLAQDHAAIVVAVDYRLAPETPFPGPVEDCYAALIWLFAQAGPLGIDPQRVAVFGQSAGGGLAAALVLLARDRAAPALCGQVLVYAMLDERTGTAEAPVDNPTTGEFMWTRAANRFGWASLRGAAPVAPAQLSYFSPALAPDVAGLPPTFIGVGSLDLFLEEDVAYALRLARAGVPVEAHVYNGGVHGFDGLPGPLAEQFSADLRAAFRRLLQPAPGGVA